MPRLWRSHEIIAASVAIGSGRAAGPATGDGTAEGRIAQIWALAFPTQVETPNKPRVS